MQTLQLPLGIVECVAQSQIDVLMPSTVGTQAVGMNVSARHAQLDLDAEGRTAVAAAVRSLEHHVALHDPIAESLQTRAQLACTRFESARAVDVMKG